MMLPRRDHVWLVHLGAEPLELLYTRRSVLMPASLRTPTRQPGAVGLALVLLVQRAIDGFNQRLPMLVLGLIVLDLLPCTT
jgi:hypothetical protein